LQPVGFPYGTGGSRSSPAPLWREWPGTVGPESLSQSAQRELNPHICHGKAAGGHYIMGAAHGLPVTGCHPDRAESPHGFRTSSSVAGEGVEPSFPSYQDGVLNHWTTRRSASDSCGIRTQPDWRERPATSPDVQRAVQKNRPSPFPLRSHLTGSVGGTNNPASFLSSRAVVLPLPSGRSSRGKQQARCRTDTGPANRIRRLWMCQPDSRWLR
jgi:hypothetical protein